MLAGKPEADMTYVDCLRVNESNGGVEKQAEACGKKCPSIKECLKAGKDQAPAMTRTRIPSTKQVLCFSVHHAQSHREGCKRAVIILKAKDAMSSRRL